jgi:hypothetical protein
MHKNLELLLKEEWFLLSKTLVKDQPLLFKKRITLKDKKSSHQA